PARVSAAPITASDLASTLDRSAIDRSSEGAVDAAVVVVAPELAGAPGGREHPAERCAEMIGEALKARRRAEDRRVLRLGLDAVGELDGAVEVADARGEVKRVGALSPEHDGRFGADEQAIGIEIDGLPAGL